MISSQSDPLERLQFVALRVPLHHVSRVLLCSFNPSPVDGGTVFACCFMDDLEGLGWDRR